jgi:hypothetical protein
VHLVAFLPLSRGLFARVSKVSSLNNKFGSLNFGIKRKLVVEKVVLESFPSLELLQQQSIAPKMSGWLKKLTSKGKDKEEAAEDAVSVRSSIGGAGKISALAQAHFRAQRHGNEIHNPNQSFNSRLPDASLDQMTIAVEVWRIGKRPIGELEPQEEKPLLVASRFLKRDFEHLSHLSSSYSYYNFVAAFEKRINRNDLSEKIEMLHGKLNYLHSGGDFKSVRSQHTFEVALQNLYLNRGSEDVLNFLFQPESQEARIDRLAKVVGEQSESFSAATPAPCILKTSYTIEGDAPQQLSPIGRTSDQQFPPTPEDTPDKTGAQPAGHFEAAATGRPVTPSTPSQTQIHSGEGKGLQRSGSVIHRVGSFLTRKPSISEGRRLSEPTIPEGQLSSPQPSPSHSHGRPPSSLGTSLKKAINTATGAAKKQRETREEERERFKTLFEEEGRVTFKKGGDDSGEESNELEPKDGQEDIPEEEIESPEPNEADEEDYEIPQEDRVVAK